MPRHYHSTPCVKTRAAFSLALLLAAASGCGTGGQDQLTPLARAARMSNVPTIRALVIAGADVNAPDPGANRWTPLLHAIHKGRRASVDALIAAGADVNRGAPTPLIMAAGNGHAEIVERLLVAGANPRADADELFAVAVSGGALTDIDNPLLGQCHTGVVRTLLQRAPDLRLKPNLRGRLALWFARFNHCTEVLEMTQIG
jgi:ankyrin repeat protein